MASECLEDLKMNSFQNWPEVDKKILENKVIEFVIQVNGKKRGSLKANKDITQDNLIERIVEEKDCNKNERLNLLTNAGIYCFSWENLSKIIRKLE